MLRQHVQPTQDLAGPSFRQRRPRAVSSLCVGTGFLFGSTCIRCTWWCHLGHWPDTGPGLAADDTVSPTPTRSLGLSCQASPLLLCLLPSQWTQTKLFIRDRPALDPVTGSAACGHPCWAWLQLKPSPVLTCSSPLCCSPAQDLTERGVSETPVPSSREGPQFRGGSGVLGAVLLVLVLDSSSWERQVADLT